MLSCYYGLKMVRVYDTDPGRSGSAETDLSNRFNNNHFENVKLKPDRFPKLQKLVKPDQNRFFWANIFLQRKRQKRERHGLHFIQKSDSLVEVLNIIILFLKKYFFVRHLEMLVLKLFQSC